jgi:hypothetical protein
MINSLLIPCAIKLEYISVKVEAIEICHSLIDVGWKKWFRVFAISSHILII